MDLIDRKGLVGFLGLGSSAHPIVVVPFMFNLCDNRGGSGWFLGGKGKGIRFLDGIIAIFGGDKVFVDLARSHTRKEYGPDTRTIKGVKRIFFAIPTVEGPDQVDRSGIGCPNREPGSGNAPLDGSVGPKLLIKPVVVPLVEPMNVVRTQPAGVMWVMHLPRLLEDREGFVSRYPTQKGPIAIPGYGNLANKSLARDRHNGYKPHKNRRFRAGLWT